MRTVTMVLISAAFAAAVGAVVVANRIIANRADAAAAAHEVAKRDVEVLVAARDIPQGRVLRENDLRWDKWPITTADPARVVLRKDGQSNLAHLAASATRRPILAGEPMTPHALFTPGKGAGFMAGMLMPGKKAVGITVTAASSASGFVLPGDLVDVILTIDLNKAELNLAEDGRFASRTILHHVKVLAVDQALNPASASLTKKKKADVVAEETSEDGEAAAQQGEVAIVGKTVAIEVTPVEAERVMAAQATGTLSLSLRSVAISEQEKGEAVAATADVRGGFRSATGGGVRLIKGGAIVR